MSELFLNVVGMSVSAGVIVLAVLLLRLPLKKAPKWITVLLWSIAAFRLVCPVTVESAVGLIPSFACTLQVGDALDAGIISNAGDISDEIQALTTVLIMLLLILNLILITIIRVMRL